MLTVVFATRNRCQILEAVLNAFCSLQAPQNGWKLVVVDNGSTDLTRQVITSFQDRLPLCFLYEPKTGKNFALNMGLKLAEGDLIVFTDDDVFPRSDWLVEMRKAADAEPMYSMFGGVVVPRWEVPPPPWVGWLDLGPSYTLTPSLKDGPLDPGFISLIYGPNMAIRSNIFQSGTVFNPLIGPRGADYPMGSETELLTRLAGEGYRGWHVSSAVVEHFIRKEQLEKSWVLQRAVRYGRGRQRLLDKAKSWIGIPRRLFRAIPLEGIKMAAAWLFSNEEALFQSRWRFNILRGQVIESRIMARERKASSRFIADAGESRDPT